MLILITIIIVGLAFHIGIALGIAWVLEVGLDVSVNYLWFALIGLSVYVGRFAAKLAINKTLQKEEEEHQKRMDEMNKRHEERRKQLAENERKIMQRFKNR